MSKLPKGWEITLLVGDICTKPQYGYTTKSSDVGAVRYLRTTDITKETVNWNKVPYCLSNPDDVSKYQLHKNDILVSRAGSVGFSHLYEGGTDDLVVFASYLIRFNPLKGIQPNFVKYFLGSRSYWGQISDMSAGIAVQNVNAQKLSKLELPLPPANEQKRIGDKLGQVLGEVNSAKARLDKIPAILKNFRSSILAYASSGKLTEGWRQENKVTLDDWGTLSGQEVFPFITSGSRGWAKYYSEEGPIFLRVGNLDHQTINLDLTSLQHVTPPQGAEGKRTRIQLGDILISITADVGMVALIADDIGEAYINQHLCLARQSGKYNAKYLGYYLASPIGGLIQLTNMQRGATKAGLTLSDIKEISIKIPSIEEQQEIVECVEALMALADQIEKKYKLAMESADKITQSVLAKAFRGDLVPQDPNDEPASVLLERIKAEKNAHELIPKQKSSKISKKNKEIKEMILSVLDTLKREKNL